MMRRDRGRRNQIGTRDSPPEGTSPTDRPLGPSLADGSTMTRRKTLGLIAGSLVALPICAEGAVGDHYPDHPVRIIVAFEAGSYTDVVARVLAEHLHEKLGGTFIVENRPGAGGNVGTSMVAHTAPDGYTLLFVSVATHGINPSLYKNLTYDAQTDFAPLSLTMEVPNVVVINPSLPVSTLPELIAYAKAHPGQLNYASAGIGTSQHLTGELFRSLAKVDIVHVPYRGSPAALTDLLAGRAQLAFLNLPFVLGQIHRGELRALAVTAEKRAAVLPDVPTSAEAGLPGLVATSWSGMVAPAGLPAPLVEKLSQSLQDITHDPQFVKMLEDEGAEPEGSTAPKFKTFIADEIAKWRAVVTASGASIN